MDLCSICALKEPFVFNMNVFIAETIDKVIHFLSNANNMVDRRYCGLSNVEIANALTRVAVNDENKKMVIFFSIDNHPLLHSTNHWFPSFLT